MNGSKEFCLKSSILNSLQSINVYSDCRSFETASGMLTYDNTFGGSNAYGLVRRAACVGTAVGNICTFANQLVRDYSVRSILSRGKGCFLKFNILIY